MVIRYCRRGFSDKFFPFLPFFLPYSPTYLSHNNRLGHGTGRRQSMGVCGTHNKYVGRTKGQPGLRVHRLLVLVRQRNPGLANVAREHLHLIPN